MNEVVTAKLFLKAGLNIFLIFMVICLILVFATFDNELSIEKAYYSSHWNEFTNTEKALISNNFGWMDFKLILIIGIVLFWLMKEKEFIVLEELNERKK